MIHVVGHSRRCTQHMLPGVTGVWTQLAITCTCYMWTKPNWRNGRDNSSVDIILIVSLWLSLVFLLLSRYWMSYSCCIQYSHIQLHDRHYWTWEAVYDTLRPRWLMAAVLTSLNTNLLRLSKKKLKICIAFYRTLSKSYGASSAIQGHTLPAADTGERAPPQPQPGRPVLDLPTPGSWVTCWNWLAHNPKYSCHWACANCNTNDSLHV